MYMMMMMMINCILQGNGNAFSDCDVSIFEAFAIFCGLGIHNTQMYENACKSQTHFKWALTKKCVTLSGSNTKTTLTFTANKTHSILNKSNPTFHIHKLHTDTGCSFYDAA